MLGSQLVAPAPRRPDDQRHLCLAAEHVADFCGVVDDLVHGQEGKIDRHQLCNRPQTRHGCTDGRPDDQALGNGHVNHALLTEFCIEPLGYFKCTAVQADIFAQDETPRRPVASLLSVRR